ncbi:VOC family protein [Jiella sp. M17.18]|uniref:VOC family protein n=1 Tax=Jiella sp. M17.18 TaxID=3234247 RepID=UPI0034DE1042
MLTIDAIDHIVLNVADVERAADWYARVLGMRRVTAQFTPGGASRTSMMFGQNKINLRPVSASQAEWFTGLQPQPGSDDLCFLTSTPPEEVAAHFARCSVDILLGPVTRSGARGDIRSVYVRDPDGNLVEVSSYAR